MLDVIMGLLEMGVSLLKVGLGSDMGIARSSSSDHISVST